MIQIRVSEDMLQDLNDGYIFYETQSQGLGNYLATCLLADIKSLKDYGGIYR